MGTHLVLVPGFWLGAWAWEAVAEDLRARGHRVDALTLPGLESVRADRSGITLDDHVGAVVKAVAGGAVVVAHSGAGPVAYAASDRVPADVARLVYVDTGPLPEAAALRPDLDAAVAEIPLPPWAELEAAGNSLMGLDGAALDRFRERAVPHPAGPARTPPPCAGTRAWRSRRPSCARAFRPRRSGRWRRRGTPWRVSSAGSPTCSMWICRPGTGRCGRVPPNSRRCSTRQLAVEG
ncbi:MULTISPECIES: alpha/beta fold hydrolase [Rhodococcus]|uniref:alpha/beta fold hydrolase n=1 Tax=Rhodococcus TaxID=1827 RepID=UPI00029A89F0